MKINIFWNCRKEITQQNFLDIEIIRLQTTLQF